MDDEAGCPDVGSHQKRFRFLERSAGLTVRMLCPLPMEDPTYRAPSGPECSEARQRNKHLAARLVKTGAAVPSSEHSLTMKPPDELRIRIAAAATFAQRI